MHGLYFYLEIIKTPTTLITSGQRSRNFGPSSYTKNYTATLQPNIAALGMIQKIIFKCCGRIGNKDGAFIIRDPKFLPPILQRNMNQFNALCGYESTDPTIECNIQPPAVHFKSRTSTPIISPLVSAIMELLNNNAIDNGDVEVHPSDFTFEYNY